MKNVENLVKENTQVPADVDETMEVAEEKEGLKRKERVIIIIVGIILLLLLIGLMIFCINGMTRGGSDARSGVDDSATTSDVSSGNNQNGSESTDNNGNGNSGGNQNVVIPPDTDNNGNGGVSTKPNPGTNNNNDSGNGNSDTDPTNPPSQPSDNPNNKPDDENNNNTVPNYTGEVRVTISEVNVGTGIITITVDGEKLTVPVQTTVFNGRVTKTGVAQGKLFGYNCGATLMLFYPEMDGFNSNSVNGYMNRDGSAFTLLVDINGSDSKLLVKINGMKALP